MAEAGDFDQQHLKRALKDALSELLREQPELLREPLTEALEDVALQKAIREGQQSPLASREETRNALRGDG